MTATNLYGDSITGTHIVFNGEDEVRVTVAHGAFGKLTMRLDLDEVDRLLAVVEAAVDPAMDIAEHLRSVYHCDARPADRAAAAFVASAGSLADIVYG